MLSFFFVAFFISPRILMSPTVDSNPSPLINISNLSLQLRGYNKLTQSTFKSLILESLHKNTIEMSNVLIISILNSKLSERELKQLFPQLNTLSKKFTEPLEGFYVAGFKKVESTIVLVLVQRGASIVLDLPNSPKQEVVVFTNNQDRIPNSFLKFNFLIYGVSVSVVVVNFSDVEASSGKKEEFVKLLMPAIDAEQSSDILFLTGDFIGASRVTKIDHPENVYLQKHQESIPVEKDQEAEKEALERWKQLLVEFHTQDKPPIQETSKLYMHIWEQVTSKYLKDYDFLKNSDLSHFVIPSKFLEFKFYFYPSIYTSIEFPQYEILEKESSNAIHQSTRAPKYAERMKLSIKYGVCGVKDACRPRQYKTKHFATPQDSTGDPVLITKDNYLSMERVFSTLAWSVTFNFKQLLLKKIETDFPRFLEDFLLEKQVKFFIKLKKSVLHELLLYETFYQAENFQLTLISRGGETWEYECKILQEVGIFYFSLECEEGENHEIYECYNESNNKISFEAKLNFGGGGNYFSWKVEQEVDKNLVEDGIYNTEHFFVISFQHFIEHKDGSNTFNLGYMYATVV